MVRSKHLIKIINKEIIGFQDPPQSHESLYNFNTKILSSPIVLQVCYARLLDYKRKFIEAAQRYLAKRGLGASGQQNKTEFCLVSG